MKRSCGTCSYLKPESSQGAFCGRKAMCFGIEEPSEWVPIWCLRIWAEEPV